MTFMFSFDADNIANTRTNVIALVFIAYSHTTMALLNFENSFCLPSQNVILFVLFSLKPIYFHELQDFKHHLNYCSPITVFSSHMFLTGCGMFEIWCVWDVESSRCGMSGTWEVGNLGCGMFGMWDVGDVGCLWDM